MLSLVRTVGDPVYLVISLIWLGMRILIRLWWAGRFVRGWARQKELSRWLSEILSVGTILLSLALLALAGVWLMWQDPLIIEWVILAGLIYAGIDWIVLAARSLVKERPTWQRVLAIASWIMPLIIMIGWWGYFAQKAEAFTEFRQADATVIVKLDRSGRPMMNNGRPAKVVGIPTDPGDYLVIRTDGRMFIFHLPEGYTRQGQRKPGMMYLHGSDESAPWEVPFSQTRFSQRLQPPDSLPDRLSVYPISRWQYRFFGERRYAWNSSSGSLSPYTGRNDDALFAAEVRNWMVENLGLDGDSLTLIGFSDGAVTAGEITKHGLFPVYRFVSLGGTSLSRIYPKAKALKEVVIQLNKNDDTTLPNHKNGQVVKGSQYTLALLGGYHMIRYSRPADQVKIWRDYFKYEGGIAQEPTYSSGIDWQCVAHTFRMPDGSERQVIVLSVEGGHAIHGSPGGGSPDDGIIPNPHVDLVAFLAYRMDGRLLSECLRALSVTM